MVELEKKISELKLKLNLGDKTDYKSQKKEKFKFILCAHENMDEVCSGAVLTLNKIINSIIKI